MKKRVLTKSEKGAIARMSKRGLSCKYISQIMKCTVMQAATIKAHVTMGTY